MIKSIISSAILSSITFAVSQPNNQNPALSSQNPQTSKIDDWYIHRTGFAEKKDPVLVWNQVTRYSYTIGWCDEARMISNSELVCIKDKTIFVRQFDSLLNEFSTVRKIQLECDLPSDWIVDWVRVKNEKIPSPHIFYHADPDHEVNSFLINLRSGKIGRVYQSPQRTVAVAVSGERLLVTGLGSNQSKRSVYIGRFIRSIKISPDDRYILLSDEFNQIRILDLVGNEIKLVSQTTTLKTMEWLNNTMFVLDDKLLHEFSVHYVTDPSIDVLSLKSMPLPQHTSTD